MKGRARDVRKLIHTPAEIAQAYVAYAKYIREEGGVTWGIPAVDRRAIPMRPGDLICLIARPGHAKTSVLARLARLEAGRIIARGAVDRQCVVYATWEQSMEELNALFEAGKEYTVSDFAWGRVAEDVINKQAAHRPGVPIWVMGHGIGRAGAGKVISMTPEAVLDAIRAMGEDFAVKPTLALFDYLQLIPATGYHDRIQRVAEMPAMIKELALQIGCPAVCAVQAARAVDDLPMKIPRMQDAQWASSIEQTADKLFGLMRPVKYWEPGDQIKLPGYGSLLVREDLLVVRMLKQRFDRGSWTWAMHFDPATLEMVPITRDRGAAQAAPTYTDW